MKTFFIVVMLVSSSGMILIGIHNAVFYLPKEELHPAVSSHTTPSENSAIAEQQDTTSINPTTSPPSTSKDISELDVSVDTDAILLISDQQGRRTGISPLSNEQLQEIPNSAYFEDRVDNDVAGVPGVQINHYAEITRPTQGEYVVTLTGLRSGPYTLFVSAFSKNGTAEPRLSEIGTIKTGSQDQFVIMFSSEVGSDSTLTVGQP